MTNAAEVERVRSAARRPAYTQTGTASAALVTPFLSKQYTGDHPPIRMDEPAATVTTQDHHGLVSLPPQIVSVNYFDDRAIDARAEPYPTQTTQTKWAVLRPPAYLAQLHGTSDAKALTEPLGCVLAGGNHHALVETRAFLSYYYSTGRQSGGLAEPFRTVTTRDRAALIEAAREAAKNVRVEDCTFRMLQPHEIQRGMAALAGR